MVRRSLRQAIFFCLTTTRSPPMGCRMTIWRSFTAGWKVVTPGYWRRSKRLTRSFGLDPQDVVLLNYFPGELFWRVPSQRKVINATTDIHQLNKLGVAVIDKKTMRQIDPDKFAEAVKADPSYFQRLRNVLPATTYWNLMDCTWPATVKTFPGNFPPICGDNPVILRHPEKADPFLDDLSFRWLRIKCCSASGT
jgi:hypothetical protein